MEEIGGAIVGSYTATGIEIELLEDVNIFLWDAI